MPIPTSADNEKAFLMIELLHDEGRDFTPIALKVDASHGAYARVSYGEEERQAATRALLSSRNLETKT